MTSATRHSFLRRAGWGFTLVEALAAVAFMAIVVPVAVHGIQAASYTGEAAHQRMRAMLLAESKLNEFMATGEWVNGDQSDQFDENDPNFRWELKSDDWDVDQVKVITMTVYYKVHGRELSVSVDTLGDPTAAQNEESGQTTATGGTVGN